MAEPTITKLATMIFIMSPGHLILVEQVKGQGHRVTKCKKRISLHSIEWPASIYTEYDDERFDVVCTVLKVV